MKISCYLSTGVSILALAGIASLATSASAHPIFYPYKHGGAVRVDSNRPVHHVGAYLPPYVAPSNAGSGTWTDLKASLPFTAGPWGPMLLTDGTVVVDDLCTNPGQWFRLTPDKKGSYVNGTWKKTATMPSGYSPLFYAQQVLTDGRMIINGGEYNTPCNGGDWTNKGALYDPVADKWSTVNPPSGWSTIGDAESIVLPNGTYMLANCCDSPGQFGLAAISGNTVTWSTVNAEACGGNPCNDEQGLTSLPGGDVLMVDVWNHTTTSDDYDLYNPTTNTWTNAGVTSCYLSDPSHFELGPAALRPDGNVIVFGDNGKCNAIYNSSAGTWSTTVNFPLNGYDVADGPAAVLPDGNVLVEASPGVFNSPSHFFEFSISKKTGLGKITQVSDPTEAPNTSSFEGNLLVLPTGQVLWDDSQVSPNEVAVYTPRGSAKAAWLPKIKSVSTSLSVGSTGNAISGTNFNGFDLGGYYGDDGQAPSNFPIVRVTNNATGDICYARSYSFSTMGVWTTGKTKAKFDLPSTCETGASSLQVVVNGIASAGVAVTLS
ncbi:MAG TPA: hypothetical protein VGI20_06685 [Rhizomicrobium sp.]|jgi:hypothetical protein